MRSSKPPFNVWTTREVAYGGMTIWQGSCIEVTKVNKRTYRGVWAFMWGTYTVTVPKNACVLRDPDLVSGLIKRVREGKVKVPDLIKKRAKCSVSPSRAALQQRIQQLEERVIELENLR